MALGALLLAAPFLWSVAATAQDVATGSLRRDSALVHVPEGRTVGDAARAINDRFALCIVQRHPQQVEKTLAASPTLADRYKTLPRLLDSECFTGSSGVRRADGEDIELTTNPTSFGGALYKALVQRKFAHHPVAFGPMPVDMPVTDGPFLKFADCVVRRDPEASLALVQTSAGSAGEQEAIGRLQPQFSLCLMQGDTLEFNKAVLVAMIAEAYYRESAAAAAATAN